MLTKDKTTLQDFNLSCQYEWLETNGLGGWSGSSIIGANTRRYHGLLVAAINPPTDRMILLSKLDETLVVDKKRLELGTNLYHGDIIHPQGYKFLSSFTKGLFPQWEYQAEGIVLTKTIAMIYGENTLVITYKVRESSQPFKLELLPLMAAKNYHSLTKQGPEMHWDARFNNGIFNNQPDGKTDLFISIPGSIYYHEPRWFKNFQYSVDQYRGQDYVEDLFNHGTFSIDLKEGDSLAIIISTENPGERNAYELLSKETARRKLLLNNQLNDEFVRYLALAADQFIVKRSIQLPESSKVFRPGQYTTEAATIIAGYHWFTDWGRDTMISLPGLCLSTQRYNDAKKILSAFAHHVNQGMLPNRFMDYGEPPEYNNADGTLWYFIAIYEYLQATGDEAFVIQEILPVLKEIIDWHYKGTRYNIHVDADGLLNAGEAGQQLTWMDARIGNWVVTPRMGKPVEIQALWYNALMIFADLLNRNGQADEARMATQSAENARRSFEKQFWYASGNYLFDHIDQDGNPVAELRPNQLFAISLPFKLVEGEKARAILKAVEENLYTPVGLRSLAAGDKNYVPVYGGDQWHRDSSYHQGTVWSWLLGAYIDAVISQQVNDSISPEAGKKGKDKAQKIIEAFKHHLADGCMGTVSEIFDAESPHHPRGCVAQAWGVAELLRVITKYQLTVSTMEIAEMEMEATYA